MPKALCLTGLVVAGLVFLLFFFDLLLGLIGMADYAPFRMASMVMSILFVVGSIGLAYLSWTAFKEQK